MSEHGQTGYATVPGQGGGGVSAFIVTPEKQDARPKPIPSVLDELSMNMEALESSIEKLGHAIRPVMREKDDKIALQEPNLEPSASAVHRNLVVLATRIGNLNALVVDLRADLEV